jgi:hypothetical protein
MTRFAVRGRSRLPAAPEQAPKVERVDAVAQQDQGRRQQDQRGRRRQQDDRDAGVREGPQEVLREEQHRRQ